MNIALIAHDTKKELMVQFCIAYCGILSQHTLVATGTTGKVVSEATDLPIQCFLAGGGQVGHAGHHPATSRSLRALPATRSICCCSSGTPSAQSPMSPTR